MKKIRTIFKKLLAAALIAGAGMAAWAETKTIDLSKGRLTIRSDGYTQGGSRGGHIDSNKVSAVQYTGDYVLTGSCTADPALQIRNWSGEKMTVNITLDNASIIGANWCSAFTVGGNADVDLYLTIKGNCRVSAYNHGAIQLFANTTLYINITDTEGSSLSLESRYEPQNHPNYEVPDNYTDGVIIFERNGVVQDNKGNTLTKSYVIFNTNGGSSVKTQQIEKGAKATKPANPTKDNFVFLGWYADEDLTTEFNFNTAITENVTQVYAKWAEAVASVSNGTTTSYYGVFSDAVSAWADGTTLKLLKDIEISSTITVPSGSTRTLDLNGYGINGNKKVITVIVVNGNLTLKDSNPGSTHKFTVSNVASNGAGLATVNDALTGTEGTDYKTFTGGYITGGTSKGENCGGGIRVVSGAKLNMEGGTIIGNGTVINYDTGMRGSGVMVQGTFNMSGGNIIYNYVYNEGGGVDVLSSSANMTMSGVKISYNYANMEAGGVHGWDKPTFTMSGGEITSNYSKGNTGGVDTGGNYGTTKLSGSPVIKDNIAGTHAQNLYIKSGCIQIIGELTDEAAVYVTMPSPGVFTNSANKTYNDASKFFSDDAKYTVLKNSDGQLKVSVPPVATVTTSAGVTTEYATFASALSAWVTGSTLKMYKDASITTSIIPPSGTSTLDLNGCGILMTGNQTILKVADNTTLTMVDNNPLREHYVTLNNYRGTAVSDTGTETAVTAGIGTGVVKITGGYLTGGIASIVATGGSDGPYITGAGVYVTAGTFNMEGGNIIGNNDTKSSGGGLALSGHGHINIKGGRICYNHAGNASAINIGINGWNSTSDGVGYVNISGGTIDYNYSDYAGIQGGAIRINNGELHMSGGSIVNNYGKNNAGVYCDKTGASTNNLNYFYVSGNPVIKDNKLLTGADANVYLENGAYIYKEGSEPLASGAEINVMTASTVSASSDIKIGVNFTKEELQYIHSNNNDSAGLAFDTGSENWVYSSGYFIKITGVHHNSDANSLWLTVAANTANIENNSCYVATVTTQAGVKTSYETLTEAVAAWVDGSTLGLLKNLTTDSTIVAPTGTLTFDLNGYGIRMTASQTILKVANNTNLTIKDSNPSKVHYVTLNNYRGTAVSDTGTESAVVAGTGTGVVKITGGYLTGGIASIGSAGGTQYICGGAVYVEGEKGTFTLKAGTLLGNRSDSCDGGAIHVAGYGHVNIEGGRICYNKAGNGGAIRIGMNGGSNAAGIGYVNISGGTIDYNYATGSGGGIRINYGDLTMSGGSVVNNMASERAGISYEGGQKHIYLSGNPVVKNNKTTAGVDCNIYLFNKTEDHSNDSILYKKGSLGADAELHVTSQNLPTDSADLKIGNDFAEEDLKHIYCDNAEKAGVVYDSGSTNWGYYNNTISVIYGTHHESEAKTLWLSEKANTIKIEDSMSVAKVTTSAGVVTKYQTLAAAVTAWVDESTLTLLTNCTTTTTIELKEGTHTLDLNGFGIKYTGAAPSNSQTKAAVLWVESNLTIIDSNPTNTDTDENRPTDPSTNKKIVGGYISGGKGCLVGTGNSQSKGGGIYIANKDKGKVTMNAGTIIDCHVVNNGNTNHGGGAVYIGNGLFTMNGGAILGCSVETSAGTGWGGAVCVDGNFELKGGRIEHNYITGKAANGAGVWARDNNVVTGASIVKNNNANGKPNNFQVNGDSINTTNLPKIYGLTEGADVYVYTTTTPTQSADVMFAKNSDQNSIKYIHSDNAASASIVYDDGTNNWVYYDGKILKLRKNAFAHTHNEKSLWLSVFANEANIEQNALKGTWSKFTYTEEKPNVLTAHLMSDSGVDLEQTDLTLTGGKKELTADIAPFTEETEVEPVVKTYKYNKTLDAIPTEVGVHTQNVVLTVGGADYTLTFPRKLLVLDEKVDNTAAIASIGEDEVVDVAITRSFGANFNTLCLPFTLTEGDVAALKVPVFAPAASVDKGSSRVKFVTERVESCDAGKAYLIKYEESSEWKSKVFTNKKIVKTPVDVQLTGLVVKGTFDTVSSPAAGDKTKLVLKAGGKGFTYIKEGDETQLRAFRAWFEQQK